MMKTQNPAIGFDPEKWLNLADARLGARAISVTDDWFAEVGRMLQPTEPVWKEGVFDDNGKWMDGWESRRKRYSGYDHAVIRLSSAGVIEAIDIDTRYFTGNYPPSASVDACYCEEGDPNSETEWVELLTSVSLSGDSHNLHLISSENQWTHLRLNIYPDGGVARFRVYGTPCKNWGETSPGQRVDLAAAMNGGRALACSDQHYGTMSNILMPGRGINMGDGWETARRRTPGFDWVIIALAQPGTVQQVLVDTCHFKGNYPDSCSITAAYVDGGTDQQIEAQSLYWETLLPSQKLQMDAEHFFEQELTDIGPVTHVRLNIFPDGGISRLRINGVIDSGE